MKDWIPDRAVLLVIVVGLVAIMMAIVVGIFNAPVGAEGQSLVPNWAENVLVALATGALLKLGDAISALVTLAGGRQVERLGNKLASSSPTTDGPSGNPGDPLHVQEETPAPDGPPAKSKG